MARKLTVEEERKYNLHGFVNLKIPETDLFYSGRYLVEFNPLIKQPTRAWINRRPGQIEFIIANDKADASARSVEVDKTKKLAGFYVDWRGKTNKEMVEPRYRENGNSASS